MKRDFAGPSADIRVSGLAFVMALKIGGLGLLGVNRVVSPSEWTVNSRLQWFYNVYEWIGRYLDWLDSDDQIPEKELFTLVAAEPSHYRYNFGSIPPGNGEIVF